MSDIARGILIIVIIGFVGGGYYYGVYSPSQTPPAPEIPEMIGSYLDVEPITEDPDTLPEQLYKYNRVPTFTYYTMDNHRIGLEDYKDDKKVVLFFWRTWNQSCRDHLYILQKFWLEYRNEVEIIAINCESTDEIDRINEILEEKGVQFPVIHDPTDQLREYYNHDFVPFYVLVDKQGLYVTSFLNSNYELEDIILCGFDPSRESKSGVRTPSAGSGIGGCGGGGCG